MTGVVMTAHFDDGLISRHLARLALLDSRGFASVKRELGEYLVSDVQDSIDGQRLFDGRPMPQSKAAINRYSKANKRRGGKTLIEHHHLYDSYVYQATDTGVEVGSALVYAAIHHFGGETGRKGHRFNMTARPVLGIAERQERELGDFFIAELRRAQG